MERRDFLRLGLVAGGTLATGGCATAGGVRVPGASALAGLEMEGYLKRLDASLAYLQTSSKIDSILPSEALLPRDSRFRQAELLIRKTMRSMLLVGSFSDLPEEGRAHPGMQARLWSSMTEMDEAMVGMQRVTASLSATERADLTRTLRQDPTLGARALEALDQEAIRAGIGDARRAHLQSIGKHVCFRMKQSTTSFIDEYGEKVARAASREMSNEASQRLLIARIGERSFWELQERQVALAEAWRQVPGIEHGAVPMAGGGASGVPRGALLVGGGMGAGRGLLEGGQQTIGTGASLWGIGAMVGLTNVMLVSTGSLAAPGDGAGVITLAVLLGVGAIVALIIYAVRSDKGR
jgi:hypothetical protein